MAGELDFVSTGRFQVETMRNRKGFKFPKYDIEPVSIVR